MGEMRTGLIILAGALVLPAVPAQAQHSATMTGSWAAPSDGGGNVRVHRGPDAHRGDRQGRWSRHDRDRSRPRGYDNVIVYEPGLWALYNNRSWESDSYNDWFQDQPNRALPRWVQNNGDCKRIYWSGGGWTC
jgi:hypothetical protein